MVNMCSHIYTFDRVLCLGLICISHRGIRQTDFPLLKQAFGGSSLYSFDNISYVAGARVRMLHFFSTYITRGGVGLHCVQPCFTMSQPVR